MSGETHLSELVKGMTPTLNVGEYVFCTINDKSKISCNETICTFREKEGTTIVLEKKRADELNLEYDFVASWITLMVYSSLQAIGLTAVFSTELAKHNISSNIIAGYYHDHIFVDKKDAEKAMKVLTELSQRQELK